MARFDVYPRRLSGRPTLVVDVQSDWLSDLETRAVVPLISGLPATQPISGLQPAFMIRGENHYLAPQYIRAVDASTLRGPVASLGDRRDEITRALDILLTGF